MEVDFGRVEGKELLNVALDCACIHKTFLRTTTMEDGMDLLGSYGGCHEHEACELEVEVVATRERGIAEEEYFLEAVREGCHGGARSWEGASAACMERMRRKSGGPALGVVC